MRPLSPILCAALVALLVLGVPLPTKGGPPIPAPLLKKLERDIAGALTHVAVLRRSSGSRASGPAVAAGVDIAGGDETVAFASLHHTLLRLRERLAELAIAIQSRGDPRLSYVMHIMQGELGRLEEDIATIPSLRDPQEREQAIARLERGLVQLDGATAALWTFEP